MPSYTQRKVFDWDDVKTTGKKDSDVNINCTVSSQNDLFNAPINE